MQEIEDLFQECKKDIEQDSGNLSFELGTDIFLSDRDAEEIKLLFNLVRLNIEKPEASAPGKSLLTSDLRKISSDELETVLHATEKAIELPVISLKQIREEHSRKISTILLQSDISDSAYIFNRTAKKIHTAGMLRRATGFSFDLAATVFLSAALTFGLSEYYFTDLKGLIPGFSSLNNADLLPVISLQLVTFSILFILYPLISFLLFRHSIGSMICGLRLAGTNSLNVSWSQILVRCLSLPLSILTFSIINNLSKNEALHDSVSGTRFINKI